MFHGYLKENGCCCCGSSVKQFVQIIQQLMNNFGTPENAEFLKYDYGKEANLKKYGTSQPPVHDLRL